MLIKPNGSTVQPKLHWRNRIADGFCVSHQADERFLTPLREVLVPQAPHCADLFKLGTRARFVGAMA